MYMDFSFGFQAEASVMGLELKPSKPCGFGQKLSF
ncbi:hypothetical protein V6Z12_A10G068800 [Gossypium hirsutum]